MKKSSLILLLLFSPIVCKSDDQSYSVMPYLWIPSISVNSPDIDNDGTEMSTDDYLSALDFGFMITGEARKDNLVVKGDFIKVDFSEDAEIISRPFLTVETDYKLKAIVPTLLAGVNITKTDNYYIDVLAGWRRADMDFSMDAAVTLGPFNRGARVVDLNITHDDFLFAVNGEYEFSKSNWSIPYYADIGAGDSDLTWQAIIGVDYKFDAFDLNFSYRHAEYEFGDIDGRFLGISTPIKDVKMVFSGPSIGLKFEF
jgi:hypothetical protein